MSNQADTTQVTFAVEKNEKYGDFRVVEYFDGEWNNERDNNWTKEKANQVKRALLAAMKRFHGGMVVPKRLDTALYLSLIHI